MYVDAARDVIASGASARETVVRPRRVEDDAMAMMPSEFERSRQRRGGWVNSSNGLLAETLFELTRHVLFVPCPMSDKQSTDYGLSDSVLILNFCQNEDETDSKHGYLFTR